MYGFISEHRIERTLHIGRVESRQKFCARQPLEHEGFVVRVVRESCRIVWSPLSSRWSLRASHFHRLPAPIDLSLCERYDVAQEEPMAATEKSACWCKNE